MLSSIDRIAQSISALEKKLAACTRCGACQAVCPLFARTGREADMARGKLALLDGLAVKMFDNPSGVMARLDRCLMCGSCAARCPAGVDALEIFARARFIINDVMGLTTVQRMVLRHILAVPARFDRIMGAARRVQHLMAKPTGHSGTASVPVGPSRIRSRHFVPLAPVPFREMDAASSLSRMATRPNTSQSRVAFFTVRPRVAFFTGCLLDKVYPRVARSALDALSHAGVRVILPPGQGCCGMPAVSMGDHKTFNTLLEYHVTLLSAQSFDYLVTACATCAASIKKFWTRLVPAPTDELAAAVVAIADKTMEISQFLVGVMGVSPVRRTNDAPTTPVVYHDPCHLKKSLGVTREPRQIIQANPRYHLMEMDDADQCCGMGGSFNWHHYRLSAEIGAQKRDRILETGASVVATTCPACMMQLSDMLATTTPGIRVKHVVELHAETLPGNDPDPSKKQTL